MVLDVGNCLEVPAQDDGGIRVRKGLRCKEFGHITSMKRLSSKAMRVSTAGAVALNVGLTFAGLAKPRPLSNVAPCIAYRLATSAQRLLRPAEELAFKAIRRSCWG